MTVTALDRIQHYDQCVMESCRQPVIELQAVDNERRAMCDFLRCHCQACRPAEALFVRWRGWVTPQRARREPPWGRARSGGKTGPLRCVRGWFAAESPAGSETARGRPRWCRVL